MFDMYCAIHYSNYQHSEKGSHMIILFSDLNELAQDKLQTQVGHAIDDDTCLHVDLPHAIEMPGGWTYGRWDD